MATQAVRAIVGLGNPGPEYASTRHNVGARLVETLARDAGQSLRPEKKYHGLYARIHWQGLDIHLLNPTTYMNRSGLAIKSLSDFFQLEPEAILVVHDELDLDPGIARLKASGGHGGHNGLRDTIAHLGSNAFLRLRLGIGHPGDRSRVVDYVLGRPGKTEDEQIAAAIDQACRVLPEALCGQLQNAMKNLHSFSGNAGQLPETKMK